MIQMKGKLADWYVELLKIFYSTFFISNRSDRNNFLTKNRKAQIYIILNVCKLALYL